MKTDSKLGMCGYIHMVCLHNDRLDLMTNVSLLSMFSDAKKLE